MPARLLFFAQSARWVGRRDLEVPLPAPKRVIELLDLPELGPLRKRRGSLKVAVNETFADFDAEVRDGDEVAFLPPFSGG